MKLLACLVLCLSLAAGPAWAGGTFGDDEKKLNGDTAYRVRVKIEPGPRAGRVACINGFDSAKGKMEFWGLMWSQVRCRAYPARGYKMGFWKWRDGELSDQSRVRFRVTEPGWLVAVFQKTGQNAPPDKSEP